MKKLLPLLSVLFLISWGCEDKDTTTPTVTITSPQTNSTVFEIVTITCMSSDNEGVEKVELWVNGVTTGLIDETEPYSINWNTTTIEDGSYTIIIRSYDTSGNTTDSEPIILNINNFISSPQRRNIVSVSYTLSEMTVVWEQSYDGDFKDYKLLYSNSESGIKDTILTYTDRTTTSHIITDFNPSVQNWFWIKVTDTLNLSSIGTGMSNSIDLPPENSYLYPIDYTGESFLLIWRKNNESDFSSYSLIESNSSDMNDTINIFSSNDMNDTSFVITNVEKDILKYYQIIVEDVWGFQSKSNTQIGDSHNWFVKTFGGTGLNQGYSVLQTNDGGFIISGETEEFEGNNTDFWLIKTDFLGNEEWNMKYDRGGYDYGSYNIEQTDDNGFILIGETNNSEYTWLIKTDHNGNQVWNQTFYNGNHYNRGYSVKQTIDGGYIITGIIDDDLMLIKTDNEGNEIWNKKYGNWFISDTDIGHSVQQTSDGGYIISGSTKSTINGNWGILLLKIDQQGNEEWVQIFGNNGEDEDDKGFHSTITSDGGYIVVGYIGNSKDIYLVKTDPNGNEEWSHSYGGNQDDIGYCVQKTNDGGYIITGGTKSFGNGNEDVWLIKTDQSGNEEWNKTYGGNENDYGRFVKQTLDGGYIIVGSTYSYGNGNSDVWLIKTDSQGNTEPYGE